MHNNKRDKNKKHEANYRELFILNAVSERNQ